MRLKSFAALAVSLFAVGLLAQGAHASDHEASDAGKELYTELRCQMCHSIESLDILSRGGVREDLSKVGETRDAEWLKAYLQREEKVDDKEHPTQIMGINEVNPAGRNLVQGNLCLPASPRWIGLADGVRAHEEHTAWKESRGG